MSVKTRDNDLYVMMKAKLLLLLFCVSLITTSCFEDQDDNPREASTLDIQNFIWRGLNFFYLYKDTNLRVTYRVEDFRSNTLLLPKR